jgi:serine/threonine-protein kinase
LGGRSAFGGSLAAPIWHDFMIKAVAGMPILGFPNAPPPAGGNVPNVVGKKQDEAIKILTDANFTPNVQMVDAIQPAGIVVAQAPCGGCSATLGSVVTIQVSNGTPPKATVPRVVGSKQNDATRTLQNAGFVVKVVYQPVDDPKLDGIVLAQSPKGGTHTTAGTTVTITVGQKNPGPTPSP